MPMLVTITDLSRTMFNYRKKIFLLISFLFFSLKINLLVSGSLPVSFYSIAPQTMIFNDIQDPIDSKIGHSSQTGAQVSDNTNATDAQLLSQRVLYIDDLSWSTDGGLKFSKYNSNVIPFPQALWHSNGGVGERDNVILTTLNKWRYLKADFNVRVAFNATAYTQGKFVMFYIPLGTKVEAESVDLTRAFQLRHAIIDANSEKDYTSFTIPFEPIYGAIDLVDGMGEMGFLGVLPYNTLKDATIKELISKVQINLTNVSLSYNNSIGTTKMPPIPVDELPGRPESEPSYYQNFPAKDYTHSDWKHDYPTLLARDSQQSSKGTTAGMTGRGPFSIPSFAKEWGYLGTARYSTTSPIDQPIMTFPVAPALLPDTNGASTSSFTPTPLTFAAMQGNWWNGDLKFKFTMTKTQLHAGRIRVIYVPFSTINRFQPYESIDKTYGNTIAMKNGNSSTTGSWDMTLLSNVRSFVFEVGDSESEFEVHIPFNAIYGSLPVIPITLNGTEIHAPGNISGSSSTQLKNTLLDTPSLLGQIYIVPETKLVTQETLTASHIDINVFHAAGDNINFYQFNNNTAGWAESGVELVEDDCEPSTTIQETDAEPIILQDAPPVEPAFTSFGTPLGSIKELCSRPVFKDIGFGDAVGKIEKIVDPSNFQSDKSSIVPIEYYSKMYRLYQGERKYLLKTPALSLDAELGTVTIEKPDWYDPVDPEPEPDPDDPDEPTPPDYSDIIEAIEDKHYTLDLGAVNDLIRNKIELDTQHGQEIWDWIDYLHSLVNPEQFPVVDAAYQYFDKYTDGGQDPSKVIAVKGNVRPLYQEPGSFLYHEAPVPKAQAALDEQTQSNIPSTEKTPIISSHLMPFPHHLHLKYDETNYFTPQRHFPNVFLPNNDQTFYFSETSFNDSPLIGARFRNGPVGLGKYYEIETVDLTTAKYTAKAIFDGAPLSETLGELKTKLLTGVYEAFDGPSIGDIPSEPLVRDTKFCRIINSVDEKYECEMFDEAEDQLINKTNRTFQWHEFEAMLGDQITDFTGTMFYDVVPGPYSGDIKLIQGDLVQDRTGKIYQAPFESLVYMFQQDLTHSHNGLPNHTHHSDGSITVHGYKFPTTPAQMTTQELYHYWYHHYKWLVDNDGTLPIKELADIAFYIDKYENDPTNFPKHFVKWLKYNIPMKSHYWPTLDPLAKAMAIDPNTLDRLMEESSDAQLKNWLDQDYATMTFYAQGDVMTAKVTHSVYGFDIKHSHVTRGGYYLQVYDPTTDPYSLNDKWDVTYNPVASIMSVAYQPKDMRSIIGNVVAAESYATNSVELVRNVGTLRDENDSTLHTIPYTQAVGGIFSFFKTIASIALDVTLSYVMPAITSGRSKPSNIKNKKKSKSKFDATDATNAAGNAATSGTNVLDAVSDNFDYGLMANKIGETINNKFPPMYNSLVKDMTNNMEKANLKNLQKLNDQVLSEPYEMAWEPNSVATPATCFCHTFQKPSAETLKLTGIDAKMVQTPLEEASAQLSPHPFFGNVKDLSTAPSDVMSNLSNSSFSTQLCTRLNNFLPFQIPFYNSSVAQRIGKNGSPPLPGTSRAVGVITVDSQGIKVVNNVAYLSKGQLIPWYALPAQISVPTYGIHIDQDSHYGKPVKVGQDQAIGNPLTTNSVQTQLATYAADNFTFGEYIGFPKMNVSTIPTMSSTNIAYDSGIYKT